jgi:hypothetical protein
MTFAAALLWLSPALALQPGPYALEVDVVTETKLPVVGTKQVHTVSAVLVGLSQEGARWFQEQRTCEVLVSGGGPAKTTIPPAFVAALPVQRIPVELGEGTYRVDGGPETLGADPSVPLPKNGDDPSVRDPDGDGKPGVTVWVDAPVVGRVEMYVAQRAHSVLEGTLGDGGASGQVVVQQMEQRTLGASNSLLAVNPKIYPVAGASRFRLVPIERSDCDAVREALRGPPVAR